MVEISTILETRKPFLPPATGRQQVHAAWESVNSLLIQQKHGSTFFEPGTLGLMRAIHTDLRDVLSIKEEPTLQTVDQCLRASVAAIDLTVFDGIRAYVTHYGVHDAYKGSYVRTRHINGHADESHETHGLLYFTRNEFPFALRDLAKNGYITIPSLEELYAAFSKPAEQNIVLGQFVDYKESEDLYFKSHHFLRADLENTKTLLLPVQITDSLYGFKPVGTSAFTAFDFSGDSTVPRQEIWYQILSAGGKIFPHKRFEDMGLPKFRSAKKIQPVLERFNNKIRQPIKGLDRSTDRHRRKYPVWINSNPDKISAYKTRHEEHIQHHFGREHAHWGNDTVRVTRSCVATNQAVAAAVARMLHVSRDQKPMAEVVNNWYYENVPGLMQMFDEADDDSQTQALFINLEPNFAAEEMHTNYAEVVTSSIKDHIARARYQPDLPFFMVIDKTSNLLFQSFAQKQDLPANLTIVETASLSKHQRNGRHFFFGMVQCWGSQEFKNILDEELTHSSAEITPLGVVHFPRVTRAEIATNLGIVRTNGKIFEDAWNAAQAGVPEHLKWKVFRYNYYAYLMPPTGEYIKEMEKHDTLPPYVGNFPTNVAALGYTVSFFISKCCRDLPGLEYGSSYGLDTTRFRELTGSYMYEGQAYRQNIPRISFGLRTDPQVMRLLAERLVNVFVPPDLMAAPDIGALYDLHKVDFNDYLAERNRPNS